MDAPNDFNQGKPRRGPNLGYFRRFPSSRTTRVHVGRDGCIYFRGESGRGVKIRGGDRGREAGPLHGGQLLD